MGATDIAKCAQYLFEIDQDPCLNKLQKALLCIQATSELNICQSQLIAKNTGINETLSMPMSWKQSKVKLCDSEEFFPQAASTCRLEKVHEVKTEPSPILSIGVPKQPTINRLSNDYVPETCPMLEETQIEGIDGAPLDFTIVPETQDAFPEPFQDKTKNGPKLERKVQNFDNICSDVTETFGVGREKSTDKKESKKSEEMTKDEQIREKYPPLQLTTVSMSGNLSSGGSEVESPSVLTSRLNKRSRSPQFDKKEESEDDDDDFMNYVPPSAETKPKKSAKRVKGATNAYGMTVSTPSSSQVTRTHRMRQTKISDVLSGKQVIKSEDEDMRKALAASREDAKREAKKSKTVAKLNDSFDEYEPEMMNDENARIMANVPVKSKEAREKLKGFSCKDCEKFYAEVNLTDSQRQEVIQKCSRHRATIEPPPDSPKEMWNLDIDAPENKTQVGSPLKTRKLRKESKLSRSKR